MDIFYYCLIFQELSLVSSSKFSLVKDWQNTATTVTSPIKLPPETLASHMGAALNANPSSFSPMPSLMPEKAVEVKARVFGLLCPWGPRRGSCFLTLNHSSHLGSKRVDAFCFVLFWLIWFGLFCFSSSCNSIAQTHK